MTNIKSTTDFPTSYRWSACITPKVPQRVVQEAIFLFLTERRSYASAVLGVVILSVCLSVRVSHACFVIKPNNVVRIFWYRMKGQSLWFSDTNSGWLATPLSSEICSQSDTSPSKKSRLRRISIYYVSTVRDSEKCSIMTNRKLTTGFPTSYRWSACITPKVPQRVVQEAIFCFLPSDAEKTYPKFRAQKRVFCFSNKTLLISIE